MELSELKALMAASLLAGSVKVVPGGNALATAVEIPNLFAIEAAVGRAQDIWEEVIRQENA
jgi:hypothetical protein